MSKWSVTCSVLGGVEKTYLLLADTADEAIRHVVADLKDTPAGDCVDIRQVKLICIGDGDE